MKTSLSKTKRNIIAEGIIQQKKIEALMLPPPPYTFNRWFNGEYFLESCSAHFEPGIHEFCGVPAYLIEPEELKIIQTEQKNIFDTRVKVRTYELEHQSVQFLNDCVSKKELCLNEIAKCESILSENKEREHETRLDKRYSNTILSSPPIKPTNQMEESRKSLKPKKQSSKIDANSHSDKKQELEDKPEVNPKTGKAYIYKELHNFKYFDLILEDREVQLIREYASQYLFSGKLTTKNFVNSPNFIFRNDTVLDYYVYSHALFNHIEFLKSTFSLLGNEYLYKKIQSLTNELNKYGFFELPKVKLLSRKQERGLVCFLCTNSYVTSIASLYFLGFVDSLEKSFPNNKSTMYKLYGKWFDCDKSGVNAGKNIRIIRDSKTSTEHTAFKHLEPFEKFYTELLNG